jgi:hypothetical protein
MQPRNKKFSSPSSARPARNVVESAAILMEFVAVPY